MGWWDAISNAAQGAWNGISNAAQTVGNDVTWTLQNPSSPLVQAENWVNHSPVAPIIDAINPGIGVSTGFGSGTPTGTTVHQGMSAPTPAPVSNQTINNNLSNAVQMYHQNTPSVTRPTNPVQTIPNPQAYSPGYKPVGQVNSTNYNGAQPLPPKTSGSSTSASVVPPAATTTTPAVAPAAPASKSTMTDWVGPAIAAGGAAIQGITSAAAGNSIASTENQNAQRIADAMNNSTQLQRDEFNQTKKNEQTWLQTGTKALGDLQNYNPGTYNPNDYINSEAYNFSLNKGLEALQNSAAARGQLLSGNTMRGIIDYAQQASTQAWQNGYNNWFNQQTQNLNRLQSLAGIGQTATQQVNNAGQDYANNAGNLTMQGTNALSAAYSNAANANASAYVGAGNAANNAANAYNNMNIGLQYLNALKNGNGS